MRLASGLVAYVALYAFFLFVPAGTLHWTRGWVFIALLFAARAISNLYVLRHDKALLLERSKLPLQRGQPVSDKVLLPLLMATNAALVAFISLDVFRFHLLPKPSLGVSLAGMILFIAGWCVVTLVFRTNAFALTVVRHQEERGQTVIRGGPYSFVRHPMYLGLACVLIGMCLWLESYAAALLASIPIGLLIVRIIFEERLLRRELRGYDEYAAKVRWRLLPAIW